MQIGRAAYAVGFEDFWIRGVDSERGQAVMALILLKPLPSEVVSELVTLRTNKDGNIAAAACCVLTDQENKHSVDADLFKIPLPLDFE
jgi:hypothetical protein